jgi:hypothetical protein
VGQARSSALGTAVLVAATAIALALGGWWWLANAPAPPDPPGAPAPPSPTELPTTEPAAYPHPSEILQFDVSQVEELLPEHDEVIRREAGVLTDGGSIDYSGTVPSGARFQLEYACLGEGELEVEVVTPDGSAHHRLLGCDATLESFAFTTGSTGYGVVRVVAHTTRFVGVAVQLVPL